MHVKGKTKFSEEVGLGRVKRARMWRSFSAERDFQIPLIISQHCLKTSPFLSLLPPPPSITFMWVLKRVSECLSPYYQSVTFPIYLLHCCQSIFLNRSLIIVSAAYLTKSQTQHGTQGLPSSVLTELCNPSPFCISPYLTACFPISFIRSAFMILYLNLYLNCGC